MSLYFDSDHFRLDPGRLKKITLVLCFIPFILSSCDTVGSIYVAVTDTYVHNKEINAIILSATAPGAELVTGIFCWLVDSNHCHGGDHHSGAAIAAMVVAITIYILLPCTVFVVCAVLQIRFLYKHLASSDNPYLKSAGEIAVTVCMITGLFFLCHIIFYIGLISFAAIYFRFHGWSHVEDKHFSMEVLLGLAEFTLPLFNAAVFPFILIFRNKYLRNKYLDGFKIFRCKRKELIEH